jgi:hypothetical protein
VQHRIVVWATAAFTHSRSASDGQRDLGIILIAWGFSVESLFAGHLICWSRVVVRSFGIGVGPSTGLGDVVRCGGEEFQGSTNNLLRLIFAA